MMGQHHTIVIDQRCQCESTGKLFNWNLTESSSPAVVTQAVSVEDVQRVLMHPGAFPSPVLAVGAMHSVNACINNDGGTVLDMSGMDSILGLEAHGVRVQAGCRMADIHDYLAEHGLELSFCPEIGDATVGSLVVSTSKDSSIDGPGYLSALVAEVTYVDEEGRLVTLTKSNNPAELAAFTCTYGMMGVVVEVVLLVRPRTAVVTWGYVKHTKTAAAAAKVVQEARGSCDALLATLVPDLGYVYLEARNKAKRCAVFAQHRALYTIGTGGLNELVRGILVGAKYNCFLYGQPPGRIFSMFLEEVVIPLVHYRNLFTSTYPKIQPGTPRLDFSFFEFDLPTFDTVLEGCWNFHTAFKARHGFSPRGYGIYFVHRGYTAPSSSSSSSSSSNPTPPAAAGAAAAGKGTAAKEEAQAMGWVVGVPQRQQQQQPQQQREDGAAHKAGEGVLSKPYGNYSQWGPGVSFMLDPITDDADNPLWATFNKAYTEWAVSMGAIPSLSQTKGLKPGQVTLPKHLTRQRFLTPYYKAFVA